MNKRLKKLRKTLDLTQQKFADKLGVKRNTVGQWECGINAITDQVITSICREFNVNEDWLRNGNGDMFLPVDRENEIAKMVRGLLSEENNTFKSRFITMLAGLSTSDWERLEQEARKLLDENIEIAATSSESMTVEDAEAAYKKSRSNFAAKTDSSVSNTTTGTSTINKAINQ